MIPKVVITRPLAQALPLARKVESIGRAAVVFPLLEIQRLPDESALRHALAQLDRYAMAAFVSPNAVDAAFALLPEWPAGVAVAVVGEGSRMALLRHGVDPERTRIFSPAHPSRSDSEALIEALDLDWLRGRDVLIVRGESGRELLSDALRAAGARVTQVAAYRRTAPTLDHARAMQLQQLLDTDNDWVITSSEALRILVQFAQQLDAGSRLARLFLQRLVIPHRRIAETARSLGFGRLVETVSGDEALLAALQFQA